MRSKKAEALYLMKSKVKASEVETSQLMTTKVQPSAGKSVEEKILERDRRREETRRRNEERRKQRQKTQLERKMAMKGNDINFKMTSLKRDRSLPKQEQTYLQAKEAIRVAVWSTSPFKCEKGWAWSNFFPKKG